MEEARFVHAALGHQEMEMGVKVDPLAKGLDGGITPGVSVLPATIPK